MERAIAEHQIAAAVVVGAHRIAGYIAELELPPLFQAERAGFPCDQPHPAAAQIDGTDVGKRIVADSHPPAAALAGNRLLDHGSAGTQIAGPCESPVVDLIGRSFRDADHGFGGLDLLHPELGNRGAFQIKRDAGPCDMIATIIDDFYHPSAGYNMGEWRAILAKNTLYRKMADVFHQDSHRTGQRGIVAGIGNEPRPAQGGGLRKLVASRRETDRHRFIRGPRAGWLQRGVVGAGRDQDPVAGSQFQRVDFRNGFPRLGLQGAGGGIVSAGWIDVVGGVSRGLG